MTDKFSTTILINADPTKVWAILTAPELMRRWMGDPEMKIEVETDWSVDRPIVIRGFHHVKFENKGIVLRYDREKELSYSHLSSLSRLPDKSENYSVLVFTLTPMKGSTSLAVDIKNFPTPTVRKHLEFYWITAVVMIKDVAESER